MKVDHYFDIGCCRCAKHRSTDFAKGFETNPARLREYAKAEGWTEEKNTHLPICPICSKL